MPLDMNGEEYLSQEPSQLGAKIFGKGGVADGTGRGLVWDDIQLFHLQRSFC